MRSQDDQESHAGTVTRPGWALVIPWDVSDPGGVSQVVLNLAAGLKVHGRYEPTVIVQDWNAREPRIEMRGGVRYVFTRMRSLPDAGAGFLKGSLQALVTWSQNRRFLRLLRSLNVKILNFHYPTLAAEPVVATTHVAADAMPKVIFSLHGMDIMGMADQGDGYLARYARMLAQGDALVAVSQNFADSMTRDFVPGLKGKVSVIHNGVSSEAVQRHERAKIPLPARYILNVATYEEKKGQRYLLEAFSLIASEYPDLHLVMVGRVAEAFSDLVQRIAALGLEKRVILQQEIPHDEVGAFFASATIFCLSSLTEPFGIVVLEAGVFGLPVIATRVGGVPEIIRDSRDGVLVPPRDTEALAAGLRALLDAPARAAELGTSLHDRVLGEFSWRQAAEQYVALAARLQDADQL